MNIFKPHIDVDGTYIEYNEFKEKALEGLDLNAKKEELKKKKEEAFRDRNIEVDLFFYRKGKIEEKYNEVRKLINEEIKGIKEYEQRLKLTNFILESDIAEAEKEIADLLEEINNLELIRGLTLSSKNKELLQSNESKLLQALYSEYNLGITNTSDVSTGVESLLIEEYNQKLESLLNSRSELENVKNKLKIEAQSKDIKLFKDDLTIITFEKDKAIHKLTENYLNVAIGYSNLIRNTREYLNYIKNFKATKQNRIIETFEKVLLDPSNYLNLITPNSTFMFDEAMDNIFVARYPANKIQDKKGKKLLKDLNMTHSLTPRSSWIMSKILFEAASALSIAAVGNTFTQLIQKSNVEFTESYLSKFNLLFKPESISKRTLSNGLSKATAYSQLINIYVDIANDPRAGYLNMGDRVTPIINTMIDMDLPIDTIL